MRILWILILVLLLGSCTPAVDSDVDSASEALIKLDAQAEMNAEGEDLTPRELASKAFGVSDSETLVYFAQTDFNLDGIIDVVVATGNTEKQTNESQIHHIYAGKLQDETYTLVSEIDYDQNIIAYRPTEIKMQQSERQFLHIALEDEAGSTGFDMYRFTVSGFAFVERAFVEGNGSGFSLFDEDIDGKYDGYNETVNDASTYGYTRSRKYDWDGDEFEQVAADIMIDSYPDIPAEIVSEYFILRALDKEESIYMPTVMKWYEHFGVDQDEVATLVTEDMLSASYGVLEEQLIYEERSDEYNSQVIVSSIDASGTKSDLGIVHLTSTHNGRMTILSSNPVMELEADSAIVSKDGKTVTVHNADELVYYLASDRHFILMEGDYDLYNVDSALNVRYFDNGFSNLENVVIEGHGDTQIPFITKDEYRNVLNIRNSSNITLKNLYMGHDPVVTWEYCQGAVVDIYNTDSVIVEDCTLFGSGTVGIIAESVSSLTVKDVLINDCSRNIVEISEVNEVRFSGSRFENVMDQHLYLNNVDKALFEDCEFIGELASYPQVHMDSEAMIDKMNDGTMYMIESQSGDGLVIENALVTGYHGLQPLIEAYDGAQITFNRYRNELTWEPFVVVDVDYLLPLDEKEYLTILYDIHDKVRDHIEDERTGIYVELNILGNEVPSEIRMIYGNDIAVTDNVNLNELLNSDQEYLTKEEAINIATEQFPAVRTTSGKLLAEHLMDDEQMSIHRVDIHDGEVYYQMSLKGVRLHGFRAYQINAVTGEVTAYFDGLDYMPFEPASGAQIEQVMKYLESEGLRLDSDGKIRAFLFNEQYIWLQNDMNIYKIFWLEGNGIVEEYYEYEGD